MIEDLGCPESRPRRGGWEILTCRNPRFQGECEEYAVSMLMTSCRGWPLFTTLLLAVAPALCQSNRVVEVKAAPRLETAMIPDYPPMAVAAHITGKVTVMLTVQGGRVISTKVKPSTQAIANTLPGNDSQSSDMAL